VHLPDADVFINHRGAAVVGCHVTESEPSTQDLVEEGLAVELLGRPPLKHRQIGCRTIASLVQSYVAKSEAPGLDVIVDAAVLAQGLSRGDEGLAVVVDPVHVAESGAVEILEVVEDVGKVGLLHFVAL
jgi:hypothetical protein